MGTCLESLVRELEAAMEASANGHRLRLEVDRELQLVPDRAVAIGIMVTELVTNAYRYACSGGGGIRVGLRRQGDGRLLLAVADDEVGWAGVAEARGTGVGYRIIDAMATTLKATLACDPQPMGTRVVVQFAG